MMRGQSAVNVGRRYFSQLPFGKAIRQFMFKVANRLLDRSAVPSYGQTGEDRVIDALLGPRRKGYYVDVGANLPRARSNTFALYLRGWNGVCIDASEGVVHEHRKERPKDIQVCSAVSETDGRLATFVEFDESAVSSLSARHIETWRDRRRVVGERVVRTERLEAILDRCGAPARFDLLSIDVEGHDLEVLRSLDLERYRPELIVIEIHHLRLHALDQDAIVSHLRAHDYDLVGYAVMNAYFLNARAPSLLHDSLS